MIAKIALLKPEHSRLNVRSDCDVEGPEPFTERIPALSGQVLANRKHDSTTKLSHVITLLKS